MHDRLTFGN